MFEALIKILLYFSIKHLQRAYHMTGISLNVKDAAGKQARHDPCPH